MVDRLMAGDGEVLLLKVEGGALKSFTVVVDETNNIAKLFLTVIFKQVLRQYISKNESAYKSVAITIITPR